MADYDTCTFCIRHVVVWIHTSLVFSEEYRIGHLSNVVVERTRTHQQTVSFNAIGNLGGQVAYGNGMLERAWSNFTEVAKQAFVCVREWYMSG